MKNVVRPIRDENNGGGGGGGGGYTARQGEIVGVLISVISSSEALVEMLQSISPRVWPSWYYVGSLWVDQASNEEIEQR